MSRISFALRESLPVDRRSTVVASSLKVAHGLLEGVEGVVGEPGVLQDGTACQSPLDHGTDLVEVGVARVHEEGRRLGAELAPELRAPGPGCPWGVVDAEGILLAEVLEPDPRRQRPPRAES